MSKKVKLLRGIGILSLAVLLSGSSVFAFESIYSEDANTVSAMTACASDELSPEMKEFYAQMLSNDELQKGEARILDTRNGEEFCVEVIDTRESGEANTASETIAYTNDELSPEMEEFYTRLMSCDELQEGDVCVLDTRNGEEFCVEVTDVTQSSVSTYSTSTTTSKTFQFYKKNSLGVKKNLFKVTSECTWIKGSKIVNLHCTYTTQASGVSCSWNDNYKTATNVLHALSLDVTYSGNSYFIIFGASLSVDLQTLTLSSSADYGL